MSLGGAVMCLKPQPPRPMPPEMAAWGAKHLAADDLYKLIGDTLYAQYHDEDFADLYPTDGQPGLSPVLLAFVTVFQNLDNLPDRKAAEAVEINLKWKYALHLPFDADSFDASVLCEFRKRLLVHSAAARVFDVVLAQMKALGLIKTRGTQRTDSLSLLSRARDLGRLELVFETMRCALHALLDADADWLRAVMPAEWAERYRRHCRDERQSDAERATLTGLIGDDGQRLLDLLTAADAPPDLQELPSVGVLRTVWQQQFEPIDGHMQFHPKGGIGGGARIETPYDPEARWSKKRDQGWIGYKLQVTETDDADQPHLITDIAVTPSVADDRTALAAIAARQQARDLLPGQRYVDSGYVSGSTLTAADQRQEQLLGPAREATSPQARLADGLTHKDFQLDIERRTAICPAGHAGTAKEFVGKQDSGDRGITFTFQKQHCRACPLKARCVTGKQEQRFLVVRDTYPRLERARAAQHTEAFKTAYRQHRPGIEGCLSALVRGHGIRACRYIGQAKNHLRALFVGVAVNLRRAARWVAGIRHRPKRQGLALAAVEGG
jgi:transposase